MKRRQPFPFDDDYARPHWAWIGIAVVLITLGLWMTSVPGQVW